MLVPAAIADIAPVGTSSSGGPSGNGSYVGSGVFESLIAEHLPGLRARAAQLCRGHLDPDDLVQDALMRAFQARDKLRDRARVRPWLLAILMNTFIDELRKRRGRPQQIPLDVEPRAEEEEPREPLPWESISAEELRAAIERLPDDVRETYRLFALEGKGYVEISRACGVPKSTVGTRLLRARKRLRALLARGGERRW